MEAALVPGILLSNKEIKSENPALTDLAPTVLGEFGIPKQEGMIGESIFKDENPGNKLASISRRNINVRRLEDKTG